MRRNSDTRDPDSATRIIEINGRKIALSERPCLGSGLGGQVWTAAIALCKQLDGGAIRAEEIRGRRVLEVGSGCGLGGIFALELGAGTAILTDYDHQVLLTLSDNVRSWAARREDDSEMRSQAFVRRFDWLSEPGIRPDKMRDALEREREFCPLVDQLPSDEEKEDSDCVHAAEEQSVELKALEADLDFDFIIGADVLYEYPMAVALPCVIRNRLSRSGTCILVNGTRIQEIFDQFLENCTHEGLTAEMSMISIKDDPDVQRFTAEGCPAKEEGLHSVLMVTHSKRGREGKEM